MTSNGFAVAIGRGDRRCRARRCYASTARRAIGRRDIPLLVGALEHFLHSRVSTYDSEKYLRPYKRNLVDVYCSKESLKRALDVASALFLALEDRGHRVVLAPSDELYLRRGLSHRDGEKLDDHNDPYAGRRGPAKPTQRDTLHRET